MVNLAALGENLSFQNLPFVTVSPEVFSTYVEMNRLELKHASEVADFLYVCGDEPFSPTHADRTRAFSLRMWR